MSVRLLTVPQSPWAPDAPFAQHSPPENTLQTYKPPSPPTPISSAQPLGGSQETWDWPLSGRVCHGQPCRPGRPPGDSCLWPQMHPSSQLGSDPSAPGFSLAEAGPGGVWRLRPQALVSPAGPEPDSRGWQMAAPRARGAAEARAVGWEHRIPSPSVELGGAVDRVGVAGSPPAPGPAECGWKMSDKWAVWWPGVG